MRRSPVARRSRPRKQRKGSRAALGRLADKLWGQLVRSKGHCEMCGKSSGRGSGVVLQAAHGFSRRYRNTRWLPVNGFCLCSGCHVNMTYDPIRWTLWLLDRWGSAVYDELQRTALSSSKPDLEAALARLRAALGEEP